MDKKVYIISAEYLVDTGYVSFKFMFDSRAPFPEFGEYASHFGVVTLKDKDANYVDPFRLMQGKPGAVGPDGHQRWNFGLFKANQGMVVGMGCDEGGEEQMIAELRKLPSCVLLTHHEATPALKKMLEAAGFEVSIFECPGTLRTS